jgi:heme-degrading monooxygenase HmoA
MHTVIRHYKTNAKLIEELERRSGEVEAIMRGVPGFVAYRLVKTAGGGLSVSVFEDEAGAEESSRVAKKWIKDNVPSVAGRAPTIIQGESILQFSKASS